MSETSYSKEIQDIIIDLAMYRMGNVITQW